MNFSDQLSIENLEAYALQENLNFDSESYQKIKDCRAFLEQYLQNQKDPIYGINTGFGDLCDVKIDDASLEKLQENLVLSHACGWGKKIPQNIARKMMFLKLMSLSKGHSGITETTFNKLLELYNKDIVPVIYTQGSLGASGDLAPLAHMSLPLLGYGEVYYQGEEVEAKKLLENGVYEAINLASKEGLALLNGTQFMQSYLHEVSKRAFKLLGLAQKVMALSTVAFNGGKSPYTPAIQAIRNSQEQIDIAAEILDLLKDYEPEQGKGSVQDPYSFRCVPQVHGTVLAQLNYAKHHLENEMNSVTDNPLIFPEENEIVSGGNFHGQILASVAENLKLALAELGSISERRTFKLLSGKRGLQPFLTQDAGLESGMMIPQYLAASLVSKNKQLATPAMVDTVDSSNGQEDHVSMGANAAVQAFEICENVEAVLAVELMSAYRACVLNKKQIPVALKSMFDNTATVLGDNMADQYFSTQIRELQEKIYSLA